MSIQPKIITCAVTGAIHTPSMSPYLPVTPQEIAGAAVAAAQAGAAVLHLHARDPRDGRPDQSPDLFREILPPHPGPHRRGDQSHDGGLPAHDGRGACAPSCGT